MEIYGRKNKIIRLIEDLVFLKNKTKFWSFLGSKSNYKIERYGRVITLSVGLLAGLVIDKFLFYVTRGLSVFIPPFAVMLMKRGWVIWEFRFEKNFGCLEFLVKHFIRK